MRPLRFRAPARDGGLLAVPPPRELPAHLADNRHLLDAWDHDFQGRDATRLRPMIRRQVADASRAFHDRLGLAMPPGDLASPLVLTGHQPELYHPGVWAKNFAACHLARAFHGQALNLIVDNDIPHRHAIRVPVRHNGVLRTTAVEYDTRAGDLPYEDYRLQDPDRFHSFPDRVRAALGPAVADPVLERFWPAAEAAADRTDRVGLRFTAARHALECEWGAGNHEVPLSALCETEGFLWFVSHLLAHLPRFQAEHNAALRRYRAAHGIRSHSHPVPALARRDDWLEAPFWVWRTTAQRRRPLLARQLAHALELRIPDEDAPFLELPLTPDREACCAVDRLLELPSRGIRLRTRALTTTMFSRLLLGDLFIHGIGGAKYDELGDEIIHRFYRIQPPAFLALSMTLHLGLPEDPATDDDLRRLRRELRDLDFNPDRHLPDPHDPALQPTLQERREALDAPVTTRRQRVERFERLRASNAKLQPPVAERRAALETAAHHLESGLDWNRVARSREFSLVLHSTRKLQEAFLGLLPPSLGP